MSGGAALKELCILLHAQVSSPQLLVWPPTLRWGEEGISAQPPQHTLLFKRRGREVVLPPTRSAPT